MNCPSSVVLSIYADGELAAAEATLVQGHAAGCAACRAEIAALRDETAALRVALHSAEDSAPIREFAPPSRARDFVWLVLGTALVAGLANAFWSAVGAAIPTEITWLDPLKSGTLFESATDIMTFIVYEGPAMWTATLNVVGAALIIAFVGWLAFSATRRRAFVGMAASLLAVVVALPSTGHAFEIRRSEGVVTVAADETINDTLLAAAQSVSIDGTINGDLLAFGQEVTVRGNITGNLVTGAQRVTIEGTVGGSVLSAAEDVRLENARVGRDLYGFGNSVEIASTTNVAGNAIAGGERVDVDGRVGLDLRGFGAAVTVSGAVEGDVDGFGRRVTLEPTARVGGNVTAHVNSVGDLDIQPGAVVGGDTSEQLVERGERGDRNSYGNVGYYVNQVVRFGAAFLTGLLLLWVFPVLRTVTLPNVVAALTSAGIGLTAAVTLPVAALIVCFTIVGIPIGILTFLLGAIALYFSKAVVAQIIGRALFRSPNGPPHYAATLAAGLAIVIVAINLPWIGGFANLVLTLIGLGLIVTLLLGHFNRSAAAA
jgi:cytoskeletal protein CcmA (bactofilin family)